MGIFRFIYRYLIAIINSSKIFVQSLRIWPVSFWFSFWTKREPEIRTKLNSLNLYIRGNSLREKLVDLYMAITCIVYRQYNPDNFKIKQKDTVVDIGAHIGSFSVLAGSEASKGVVYSFEPDKSNYSLLQKNCQLNNLNNIKTFNCAVSSTKGERSFNISKMVSAENSLYKLGSTKTTVECTTLQDIFREQNIERCNFLKIDCEGAEYEIIFDTPDSLFYRVDKIVIEAHSKKYFNLPNAYYTLEKLVKRLNDLGYKTTVIDENKIHSLVLALRSVE